MARPVTLPPHERVARVRFLQATVGDKAVDVRTGHLVLEHGLAARLSEGGKVRGRQAA